MTEVISVRFRNRGKTYFFSPEGLTVKLGEKVIVNTSKGLEIAECRCANHMVEDSAIVQPLRPVVRKATNDDLRVAAINARREEEAFEICQRKILEHKLEMKLVGVECGFDGNKTTFFFISESRVDFRELVKDLAAIFRNRIELRQIGVRDEAKIIGGLGICGRPFCCSRFLDEFQPVSTKMAKVQSMSLNPSKISGTCGRLMCCLRYEQEAYEELVKVVPKLGAFVETPAGFGTVTQVNLLRKLVKVKLDSDDDDSLRLFHAEETATVPGGRPKDGEQPASVLKYMPAYVPDEPDEAENEDWPVIEAAPAEPEPVKPKETQTKKSFVKNHRNKRQIPAESIKPSREPDKSEPDMPEKQAIKAKPKQKKYNSQRPKPQSSGAKPRPEAEKPEANAERPKPTADKARAKNDSKPKAASHDDSANPTDNNGEKVKKKYYPNKRRYYHPGKPKQKTNKPE